MIRNEGPAKDYKCFQAQKGKDKMKRLLKQPEPIIGLLYLNFINIIIIINDISLL
jgi:hypothetical protein